MDKFVQYKEINTPCVLDRSHGHNEIAGFQVQNRRCQMRYRFGQVVSRVNRSILLMIAGLFLSVSTFSQTPGGPAGSYPTSEQTIQFPAKQDKTPADHQVKLIMNRMSAASNIEEPRRAYFLYSKFAEPPESVFRVEDRKIPGPGGSIPIRLYTPNARTNPAALEDTYAATKWVAEHAAEIDQNPKTPLSATPPGTFGLPPFPGSPQTPTSEANRAGGNIDLRTLAAHFRLGQRFR